MRNTHTRVTYRVGKPPQGLRLRRMCWIDRTAAAAWWILIALVLIAWSAR
jgi:hypothetical protein